jgi:hypothetical protein
MPKKKIWASFQRIIKLFTHKFVTQALKIMGLGSEIQDLEEKNLYPGSGSRGQKGPGSGSATLLFCYSESLIRN